MRVLIVTIFNSLNYGAFLQGYGLYQVLQQLGHDVKMYVADPHNARYYIHSLHLREPQNIIYNMKLLNSFYKSWSLLEQTRSLDQEYDIAIIGSDELWNVHNVNFEHTDIYLGNKINAKKICTYAISGNNTTSEQFKLMYGNEPFKYIDEISVRDACTSKFVTEILGTKPSMVVDPTLLYNFQIQDVRRDARYLVVYGYYFEEGEREKILAYAKKYDLVLISAGFVHRWCDEIFVGTPLEFLGLICHAQGVISATFHGTILSMKYNKKLAVFHHGSEKIIDALSRFGMKECCVSDENNISKCFRYSEDYSAFNSTLKDAAEISMQFIESILEDR